MAKLRTVGAVTALAAATAAGSVALSAPAHAAKDDCKSGYLCAWNNDNVNKPYTGKPDCKWYGDGWAWRNNCGGFSNKADAIYNHGKGGYSAVRIFDGAGGTGSSACIGKGKSWNLRARYKDPEVGGYRYIYNWTKGKKKGQPIITGGISSHVWVKSC